MHNITIPTLLLDETKCKKNIQKLLAKTTNQLNLRPHFKTPQSHKVGQWFREKGVHQITVSSLDMAIYFAQDGWSDITVAFPCNILEIQKINQLAAHIQLNLLVEAVEVIQFLQAHLIHPIQLFIKIDLGYGRSGVPAPNTTFIQTLTDQICQHPLTDFAGFLAHAGHSYKARGTAEILTIHQSTTQLMRTLKSQFIDTYPNLIASVGDTPTCSVAHQFEGINELRAGNFMFYDLMQWQIGSCQLEEIAVAMACPVVAKHTNRMELVLYGGGVHFSKEVLQDENNQPFYGLVVQLTDKGWSIPEQPSKLVRLSQEHGIVKASSMLFEQTKVGDLLGILPVHSCMTANLMKAYYLLDGQRIEMMV